MTERRIRVGIIGAGTFAEQCHIPGLQAHAQAEVVALCSRNRERAAALANRSGVPEIYTDYHDLIARPDLDAVTVATPDALHAAVSIAALEAGKHVFCEKPLAMNADEAQRMAEAARRAAGRVAMVAFTFRYTRAVQGLRRLLQEGTLGTPFSVALQVHWGGVGYPRSSLAWRDQAAQSSAGIWADGAAHLFDALAYILAPIREVCAQMMIVPRESGVMQPDSVDLATCLARLRLASQQDAPAYADREAGSVHVTLLTSRVNDGPDEIEVVGTRGAAKISLTRGQNEYFRLRLAGGPWQDAPLPDDALTSEPLALKRMMGAFVEAVLRGQTGPDDADFEAGLYAQRAIDAAVRSAREQRWIAV